MSLTITDVLNDLGISSAPPNHHHCTPGRVQVDCPHCSPGSGLWRMGIRENRSFYCSCWVCGRHRLGDTLALAASVPLGAVLKVLRVLPDRGYQNALEGHSRPNKLRYPGLLGSLKRVHRNFLGGRGFKGQVGRDVGRFWMLQGTGMHPRFPWSIFIPITQDGHPVSFTTRAIYDTDGPRYKSARPDEEVVPHKTLLYGEEYCTNTVVVVEGPVDVWALGPGAVCTFGTAYSNEQLIKISKYPNRVVAFDNEPKAQEVARQLCRDLQVFDGTTTNVTFDTGKDASRAAAGEVAEFKEQFLQR